MASPTPRCRLCRTAVTGNGYACGVHGMFCSLACHDAYAQARPLTASQPQVIVDDLDYLGEPDEKPWLDDWDLLPDA